MTAERMSAEELERLRVETAQFIDNGDFACDATLVQELTCDIASLLAHITALQREADAERARADAMREALEYALPIVERYAHTQGDNAEFHAEISAPIRAALSQAEEGV